MAVSRSRSNDSTFPPSSGKKDDKLIIKLKEETNTSKVEKVLTKVGVLEDRESLRLPGHLLM